MVPNNGLLWAGVIFTVLGFILLIITIILSWSITQNITIWLWVMFAIGVTFSVIGVICLIWHANSVSKATKIKSPIQNQNDML